MSARFIHTTRLGGGWRFVQSIPAKHIGYAILGVLTVVVWIGQTIFDILANLHPAGWATLIVGAVFIGICFLVEKKNQDDIGSNSTDNSADNSTDPGKSFDPAPEPLSAEDEAREQASRDWDNALTATFLVGCHPDLNLGNQPRKGWSDKVDVGIGFYSRAITARGYQAASLRFREAIQDAEEFNGEPIGVDYETATAWLKKRYDVAKGFEVAAEAVDRITQRVEMNERREQSLVQLYYRLNTSMETIIENDRKPARLKVLTPMEGYITEYQSIVAEADRFETWCDKGEDEVEAEDDTLELDDSKPSTEPLFIADPLPEISPAVAMRLARAEHVVRMLSDPVYRDRYDGEGPSPFSRAAA